MSTKVKDASVRKWMQLMGRPHVGIILFIICFGMRIASFGFFHPWSPKIEVEKILKDDALGYHQLATTLIESHRFAYTPGARPEDLRPPLYPILVAVNYFLFGYKPWAVLLVQIMLDTMACILLLVLLSWLFDRRVAFIASLLYSLDPFLIFYSSTKLLSDVFFVFLLVVAFYFWSAGVTARSEKKTMLSYGLFSLFIGLATLTRPISQYILVCPLIFFLVFYWKDRKAIIKYSILSVLIFGATLSPWLVRNYNEFGYFSLSTSGPYDLLMLTVAPMEMSKRHEGKDIVIKSLLSETNKMIEEDGLHPADLNRFQIAQYWLRLAVRYIVKDPLAYGKAYLRGIFCFFFQIETKASCANILNLPIKKPPDGKMYDSLLDIAKTKVRGIPGLLIVGIIVSYMLLSYLCTIIGLIISWKRYDRRIILFIMLMVMYFIVVTVTAAMGDLRPRGKFPLIPFYLSFTGIGCSYVWGWFFGPAKKRHS